MDNLKNAPRAFFLTVSDKTPTASGLTHLSKGK